MSEKHDDCHVDPVEKTLDFRKISTAQAAFLAVSGMGCPTCAMRVRNGLFGLEGVLYVDVYLKNNVAIVVYDPVQTTQDDLVTAVAASGNDGRPEYRARLLQTMPASEVFTLAA